MNKTMNKKPLFDRRGKSGTYAVVVSLILLAMLIVINMIAGSLPKNLTMLDTSASGQYEISGTTESFLSKINEKITFYYICPEGNEDPSFETFVERYAAVNSNFKITRVDPVEDPAFLEKFQVGELSENSIIIESEKRIKAVDYMDLFLFTNADLGYTMTAAEYMQYGAMYEQYGYAFTQVQYFDNILTLGVEYVCADKVPSMYLLNGHGEAELAANVTKNLDYMGVSYDSLNLALGESIPEDCTCIVINNPTSDLTSLEASTISSYLENGGNILLLTASGADQFANLASIAAEFGLSAEAGIVNEGSTSAHYPNMAGYIYPVISDKHEASSYLASAGIPVMLPNPHSIKIAEKSGVESTAIFTTSDKAFTVVGSDKGEAGAKNLGVVAEKGDSNFCWIATGSLIKEEMISATNNGNFYTFYIVTNWLTGNYTSSLPEIPGIELTEQTIATTAMDADIWGIVLIFIIPGAILGSGIGYSIYRRRR